MVLSARIFVLALVMLAPPASLGCAIIEETSTSAPVASYAVAPSRRRFEPAAAGTVVRLEQDCLAGSSASCFEIGRIGLLHGGLPAGLPWIARACDLDPRACVALGDVLIGRRANASSPELAAAAYLQACEAEHHGACYELGVLHYLGLGVRVDDPRTARLHERACAAGIADGCAYMAHLYRRGIGVGKDPQMAERYRKIACAQGYGDLCEARRQVPPAAEEQPTPYRVEGEGSEAGTATDGSSPPATPSGTDTTVGTSASTPDPASHRRTANPEPITADGARIR